MKFYWKVFLSIFILISLSFSICGTWMIHASFITAYYREIEIANKENSMYQIAFENAIEVIPVNYLNKNRTVLKEIAESLENGMGKSASFFYVYDEKKTPIYLSNNYQSDSELFNQIRLSNRGYEVVQVDEDYWLRVISMVKIETFNENFFVESMTNISHIYQERKQMTNTYHIIIIVLLLIVILISLMLSYILASPIGELSKITRAFANGNYKIRAKKKRNDEIGILVSDFNNMAENLSSKIGELSEHAKNQESFTSAFAHELKTPLTAIIGYADMLRSLELTREEQVKAAEYIYSQGKRLEKLSFKLMNLFVIKNQKFQFELIDSEYILQCVFDLSEVSILEKNMILKRDVETGKIYGEKDLLISLFANLIDNAKKASSEGDSISIIGINLNDKYQVIIKDEGKGIPKEELAKITNAFYMVDKSRSRKEGSAGLGMTLCSEIIKIHHAKWEIESKEGFGTEIKVTLSSVKEKGEQK